MTEQEKIEWIDSYLAGELSGAELESFEERLQREPEFAREVDLHRKLNDAILQTEDLEHFEANLANARQKYTEKRGRIRRLALVGVAVAALLISAVVFLFVWDFSPSSGSKLFAEYYQPYPDVIANQQRGDGVGHAAYVEVMAPYSRGDYELAVTKLEAYLDSHPNSDTIMFYLGISLLELEHFTDADSMLNEVHSMQLVFSDRAQWYLALSNLRQGNIEQAEKLLEEISRSTSDYKSNAAEMLSILRE